LDRGSNATSAFEMHGGRHVITGNVIKNYGILVNLVPSSNSVPELTPQNWVIANNTAICGGVITVVTEANGTPSGFQFPGARSVKSLNVSGNTINTCGADRQGPRDSNGTEGWLGISGGCASCGDAMFDSVTIANNDVTLGRPNDKTYEFYQNNAGI